jgi:hypothetical protein
MRLRDVTEVPDSKEVIMVLAITVRTSQGPEDSDRSTIVVL